MTSSTQTLRTTKCQPHRLSLSTPLPHPPAHHSQPTNHSYPPPTTQPISKNSEHTTFGAGESDCRKCPRELVPNLVILGLS